MLALRLLKHIILIILIYHFPQPIFGVVRSVEKSADLVAAERGIDNNIQRASRVILNCIRQILGCARFFVLAA
jgi:hypothetical protein